MALTSKLQSTDRKTRVFISYSRKDMDFAKLLHDQLENANYQPMLDQTDIAPGEAWQDRLSKLILQADAFVFCVSPNSAASKICHWEVDESQRLAKRLVPVVVDPVDTGDLPEAVSKLNFIFFSDQAFDDAFAKLQSALSSDLAWQRQHTKIAELADEWENASRPKSKVLSGQTLIEAESWMARQPANAPTPSATQLQFIAASRKAATRRQRITLTAAFALVVGALALAGWGEYNRMQATAAKEQTQAAYDSLVQSSSAMVDDVATKFKDVQGVPPDLTIGVLQNALSLHDVIAKAGVEKPDTKSTKLSILDKLVDAYRAKGDTQSAFNFATDAEKLSAELAALPSADDDAKSDHAVLLQKLGEVADSLGDRAKALESLIAARDIEEKILQDNKNNSDLKSKLASIYGSLGTVYLQNANTKDAEASYRKQLQYFSELARKVNINIAKNDEAQSDLAAAKEQLGAFLRDESDDEAKHNEAISLLREDLAIREKLAANHKDSVDRQSGLSLAYSNLGRALVKFGDKVEGLTNLRKFWDLADELARNNTERADTLRNLSVADNQLGTYYFENGDPTKANDYFGDDLKIARRMLEQDVDNTDKQLDVAKSLWLVANTQKEPRAPLEEAQTILQKLTAGNNPTQDEANLLGAITDALAKLPPQ